MSASAIPRPMISCTAKYWRLSIASARYDLPPLEQIAQTAQKLTDEMYSRCVSPAPDCYHGCDSDITSGCIPMPLFESTRLAGAAARWLLLCLDAGAAETEGQPGVVAATNDSAAASQQK